MNLKILKKKMLNQKNNTLKEQVKRILFISNYNLNNPPKLNENYNQDKEIDYENVEKEDEKGYPASYQYVDEYQIDEQDPNKKPADKEPATKSAKELPKKPEAGLPDLGGAAEPTGAVPGEQTLPVDTAPPLAPEPSPEEKKPEVPSATKSDIKSVEKEVESVEDYSKKVMTKQSEILVKVDDMINKLSNVDNLSQKVDQLTQNVEKIKPQSYKDKLEMISVNSKPFNVKLSDYWGLDDQEPVEQKPQEYKLDKQDIVNYDQREIKNSLFTTGEETENDIINQRKTGY